MTCLQKFPVDDVHLQTTVLITTPPTQTVLTHLSHCSLWLLHPVYTTGELCKTELSIAFMELCIPFYMLSLWVKAAWTHLCPLRIVLLLDQCSKITWHVLKIGFSKAISLHCPCSVHFSLTNLYPGNHTIWSSSWEAGRWKLANPLWSWIHSIERPVPLHMGSKQTTPAWIVTHLGIIREDIPSDQTKLRPGSLIRLHDIELSHQNCGFEKPWLFGTLGPMKWCEPNYHLFELQLHLFTITNTPYIVPCPHAYIAVPDHLIFKRGFLRCVYSPTLGQELVEGCSEVQPPLRPWQVDQRWRHPEYRRIMACKDGNDLQWVWSIANSRY